MRNTTRYMREELGLTQVQFAERYDIPLRTVQNWEYKGSCPDYLSRMIYMIESLREENKELRNKILELELFGGM